MKQIKPKISYRKNGLSIKQDRFVKELAISGNATEAVKKAGYNASSRESAASVASDNLRKPAVRMELDKILEQEQFTLQSVLDRINRIGGTKDHSKPTASDVLRANENLLKVHGLLERTAPHSVTINLNKMSKIELIEMRKAKSKEWNNILDGECL